MKTRPAHRPPVAGEPRDRRIEVRVTASEKARIEALAAERGQTVSDYGRPLLLALARDAYAAAEAFMRAPTTLRRASEITAQLEAAGLTDIDAMWGRWSLFLEEWDLLHPGATP